MINNPDDVLDGNLGIGNVSRDWLLAKGAPSSLFLFGGESECSAVHVRTALRVPKLTVAASCSYLMMSLSYPKKPSASRFPAVQGPSVSSSRPERRKTLKSLSSSAVNSQSTGGIPGQASLLAHALKADGSYALDWMEGDISESSSSDRWRSRCKNRGGSGRAYGVPELLGLVVGKVGEAGVVDVEDPGVEAVGVGAGAGGDLVGVA